MNCYKCKAPVPDGSERCPRCGAPQGFSPELILRARRNDQDAITELYNRTYSNVYYTIRSMVRDEDTALDLLQDSYLKAFRSLDQLQDPARFRAWIKRIAHNRAVDYLRQNRDVVFSALESEDSDTPVDFADDRPDHLPDVVMDRQETTRLMGEILDALPADQRAVVSMFYYEQMSVREIAAELGVSENTVKSRLNYGRKKIEAQVRALEKKGTKLYSLAPIPFLLLLFRSQEAYAAGIPAASVLQSISAGLAAETAAAGTAAGAAGKAAAKIASKTAGRALRTRIAAGVAAAAIAAGGGTALYRHLSAPPPVVQEAQVLPRDFLTDMEKLAEERLSTLLSDHKNLEFRSDYGTLDIDADCISISHARRLENAVFYETGGVTCFYIAYEADVRISDEWEGFIVHDVPHDYKNAVLVFSLDTFPLKFIGPDGTIIYEDDDFVFYRIYESRDAFIHDVKDGLQYVDHEYHDIALP